MEAIYGLALMSASVLLLAYAARFRNAPDAPKWAKSDILLQTVLFTTVVGGIAGIAMLLAVAATFSAVSFGMLEVALLLPIIAASWFCWRAIKAMPAPDAVTGASDDLPTPANNGARLRSGRKPASASRKAA